MGSKLSQEEVEHFVELAQSQPVDKEVAHEHCRPGKSKFSLRRKSDGTILGYCFHCGAGLCTSGSSDLAQRYNRTEASYRLLSSSRLNDIPESGINASTEHRANNLQRVLNAQVSRAEWCRTRRVSETSRWRNDKCRSWIGQYEIPAPTISEAGITESTKGGILLPVFNVHSDMLSFYQVRTFGKPKYLTKRYTDPCDLAFYINEGNTWIITEDILSALKVSVVGNGIALCGTSLSRYQLNQLLTVVPEDEKIAIWLDNDNPQVMLNVHKLYNTISMYRPNTKLVTNLNDPKHQTYEVITSVLRD